MSICAEDLNRIIRRSKAASCCSLLPNGLCEGWQTVRDNGAVASCWQGVSDLRVIREPSGRDVAYVPFAGPGNPGSDAFFIAHCRRDLPLLIREWCHRHAQLTKLNKSVAGLLPQTELRRAETICEHASRGPWHMTGADGIDPKLLASHQTLRIVTLGGCGDVCHVHPGGPDRGNGDALLIAYVGQAIPRLISDIVRLRDRLGVYGVDDLE